MTNSTNLQPLDLLPGELLMEIIGFLDAKARGVIRQVSKKYKKLVDSMEGWEDTKNLLEKYMKLRPDFLTLQADYSSKNRSLIKFLAAIGKNDKEDADTWNPLKKLFHFGKGLVLRSRASRPADELRKVNVKELDQKSEEMKALEAKIEELFAKLYFKYRVDLADQAKQQPKQT